MEQQDPSGEVDQHVERAWEVIAEHGWMVQGVFPTNPDEGVPFAYTVGLTGKGLPELVMYGLPAQVTHPILNDAGVRAVRDGGYQAGQMLSELIKRFDLAVIDVVDTDDLKMGERLYGRVRAQQLVFPDPNGRYPWEAGYSMAPAAQPVKGVWPNN